MNDRFKFRAWQKVPRIMRTVRSIAFGEYGYIEVDADCAPVILGFSEADLMQSTGLKDKNGKLIFEGDIVKIEMLMISQNDIQRRIRGADVCQRDCVGVVRWDTEGADFEFADFIGECIAGFCDDMKYEVIGNIWENQELLEVKQNEV